MTRVWRSSHSPLSRFEFSETNPRGTYICEDEHGSVVIREPANRREQGDLDSTGWTCVDARAGVAEGL